MVTSFPNGVKFETVVGGYAVTAVDGSKTFFDEKGFIKKQQTLEVEEIPKPEWSKDFYYVGVPERNLAYNWYCRQRRNRTPRQEKFFDALEQAFPRIFYCYNINPKASIKADPVGIDGKTATDIARRVAIKVEEKARNFSLRFGSALATDSELILWYAYQIASGKMTIEEVCDEVYEPEAKLVRGSNKFLIIGGRCEESGKAYRTQTTNALKTNDFNYGGVIVLRVIR